MTTLVLTVIGRDREGLVSALAEAVEEGGGNWEQSHLAELAGQFAGVVLVTAPPDRVERLAASLRPIAGLLDVTVERAADEAPAPAGEELTIEIVGNDHPGIVHQVSSTLARHGLSISELVSEAADAPMAGGRVFEARITATLPAGLDRAEVRHALEQIAGEVQVDLDVAEPDRS